MVVLRAKEGWRPGSGPVTWGVSYRSTNRNLVEGLALNKSAPNVLLQDLNALERAIISFVWVRGNLDAKGLVLQSH